MSDDDTMPPGSMPRRMPANWVPPPSTSDVLLRIQKLMDEEKTERTEKKYKNFKNYHSYYQTTHSNSTWSTTG